jgi:hypothetical protein
MILTMGSSLKWDGALVTAREKAGAERGLYLAAEELLKDAVDIVPLREGTLERSGVASAAGLKAAVSFGSGAAEAYAVVQHEHMEFNHPNGRQAKYLETPLNANRAKYEGIVAAEIRKSIGA